MPNNKIIYYFLCARVTFYVRHFHFPRFIPSANISKLNHNIEFTLLQH